MKRIICLFITLILVVSLTSCDNSYTRADELAKSYVEAILARDEDKMRECLHPDHADEAMPNDAFYQTLEDQYLAVGYELTELNTVAKAKTDIVDNALRCTYVARINELFYTVELIIVDDVNGYGVVSTIMMLNTEIDYYYNESNMG